MGVNVNVGKGVSVAGGGVPLGTRVTTRGGATVGGVGEANGPHDCKKTIKIVKSQLRKTGFRVFLPKKIYPGSMVIPLMAGPLNAFRMDFKSWFSESFVNRNAIPISLLGEA